MQNLYHLLGVAPTATHALIRQAYQQQLLRLRKRRPDRTTEQRLDALQTAHDILLDPPRRWAYDQLLAQELPPPDPAAPYVSVAPWVNRLLLAICLVLIFDWALPPRQYSYEPVLSRNAVVVSASLANPDVGYDIVTPHGRFRLHSAQAFRVRWGDFVTLWRTPLLGVVRRIKAPFAPDGDAPFVPDSGNLYRWPMEVLVPLLGLMAGLGLLPRRPPEWGLNLAIGATIIAVLVAVVGWFF